MQARWVIKLEKAVERRELLPMPLTHSVHPWEESGLAEIYSGGDHTRYSNSVNNSRIVLCESSQGEKKPPSIHALARRLVLMNTSVWHLDGTHATNGWAGRSFPAVFMPLWHLVQKLRKNRCIPHLLALYPAGEREGERGILSSDGELGLRDREMKLRQSPGDRSEAGRCCREHSPSRLQTYSVPKSLCWLQPPHAGLGTRSTASSRAQQCHPCMTCSWQPHVRLYLDPRPFLPISWAFPHTHFYPSGFSERSEQSSLFENKPSFEIPLLLSLNFSLWMTWH